MSHLTMAQLLEYVDGVRNDIVSAHLSGCAECRAQLQSLIAMDQRIRAIPPDHPTDLFGPQVMSRLGVRESSSLVWTVVRNLAPLIALSAVTGIVFVVLNVAGVFGSSNIGDSVSATGKIAGSVSQAIDGGLSIFRSWTQKLLPSVIVGSSSTMVFFLLAVFGGVALLDKFIFNPLWRRRFGQSSAIQQ